MASVNIQELVTKLFEKPAQAPKSMMFSFESPEGPSDVTKEPSAIIQYRNNLLMTIFINGSKILYGTTINPANMTKEQFDGVNKYMNSIGYTTKTEIIYEAKLPVNVNVWFEPL